MSQTTRMRAFVLLTVCGVALAPALRVDAASPVASGAGSGRPGDLVAVDALSPTDVWAVGYAGPDISHKHALVEHWDGSSWRRVPVPHPRHSGELYSVSAVAADDVWAVGHTGSGAGDLLVLHWNGSAWTESPIGGSSGEYGWGVSADASDDAWIVGGDLFGEDPSFLEHWDGTSWTRVTNPSGAVFRGVSAVSPTDVWAVGYLEQGRRTELTAAMHWDGASWTVVPTVNPHYRRNVLWSVSALPSGQVWAAGLWGSTRTLIEHGDGGAFVKDSAPSPKYSSQLNGVSALSATDVWAVGDQGNSAAPDNLVEHWDGTAWSRVATPKPGQYAELRGVSADAADDAWAVGFEVKPGQDGSYTWVQHWDGQHWTRS